MNWVRLAALSGCVAIAAYATRTAPAAENAKPRQARPKAWPAKVVNVFFKDARKHLVGERPGQGLAPNRGDRAPTAIAAQDRESNGRLAWSRLIDGDTLATEVKRIVSRLHEPLANATRFKADGYKQCQADFGQLAVLFGVISEYDGEVRWREDAAALRDALARASQNCTKATDLTLAEATERVADLDEVVRGGRLAGAKSAPLDNWSTLADRSILMLRMQTAWRDNVSPQLSDARQFDKSADKLRHEAQVLAMLAEVIHRQEYEYWDDESFVDYARQLQEASTALSRAATDGNYEAARQSSGRIGQACAACHDGYRG